MHYLTKAGVKFLNEAVLIKRHKLGGDSTLDVVTDTEGTGAKGTRGRKHTIVTRPAPKGWGYDKGAVVRHHTKSTPRKGRVLKSGEPNIKSEFDKPESTERYSELVGTRGGKPANVRNFGTRIAMPRSG